MKLERDSLGVDIEHSMLTRIAQKRASDATKTRFPAVLKSL